MKFSVVPSYNDRVLMDSSSITIQYDKTLSQKRRATAICHELGHVLLRNKITNTESYLYFLGRPDFRYLGLRAEVLATRLGKSICKPGLWDEDFALRGLLTHFCPPGTWQAYTRTYANKLSREKKRMKPIGIIPLS